MVNSIDTAEDIEAMRTLTQRAKDFACAAHLGQVRKYTGEPYLNHLSEVVAILRMYDFNDVVLAAAYLHDVMEDCGVSVETIVKHFGIEVAAGVFYLSDICQEGNRKARKLQTQERLKNAPGWVQSVKCADIISNAVSIREHDQKFAPLFVQECTALLDVMTDAHSHLRARAYEACDAEPTTIMTTTLPQWNDDYTAALISELTDCARKYNNAQQLRMRIAEIIAPVCDRLK